MAEKPSGLRPHVRVEDRAGLEALATALAAAPRHALDSESNSGFVYDERLCLLQLNVGGKLWVIDLVALPGGRGALDPLRQALESPDHRTCVHGGEFDVGCLKRDFGIGLRGVFDSQQAAAMLGWEKTGYGWVVEEVCGVSLPKAFTHYDWGRRPLEPRVLAYALDDVHYLLRVCESFRRAVRDAGLEEEVEIANRAVEEATWNGGFGPDGFWRMKGIAGLEKRARPLAAALYAWRDELARRLDRPPGRVLNNRLLLALARNPPRDPAGLRRFGLPGRIRDRHAGELLRLLADARHDPPPVPDQPPRERTTPAERRRLERLKEWRAAEAARRRVPLQVVLPATAMRHLQRHGAGDLGSVPQLGEKRVRLYGGQLRALCS